MSVCININEFYIRKMWKPEFDLGKSEQSLNAAQETASAPQKSLNKEMCDFLLYNNTVVSFCIVFNLLSMEKNRLTEFVCDSLLNF